MQQPDRTFQHSHGHSACTNRLLCLINTDRKARSADCLDSMPCAMQAPSVKMLSRFIYFLSFPTVMDDAVNTSLLASGFPASRCFWFHVGRSVASLRR